MIFKTWQRCLLQTATATGGPREAPSRALSPAAGVSGPNPRVREGLGGPVVTAQSPRSYHAAPRDAHLHGRPLAGLAQGSPHRQRGHLAGEAESLPPHHLHGRSRLPSAALRCQAAVTASPGAGGRGWHGLPSSAGRGCLAPRDWPPSRAPHQ